MAFEVLHFFGTLRKLRIQLLKALVLALDLLSELHDLMRQFFPLAL